MDILENKKVVYTAQSKKFYFAKMLICKYVLEHNAVPLNPFNVFGYFLHDLVERDIVRNANSNVIRVSDEIWVFGSIADGVLFEIEYGMKLNKKIKFFTVGSSVEQIKPITDFNTLHFESKVLKKHSSEVLIKKIDTYVKGFND